MCLSQGLADLFRLSPAWVERNGFVEVRDRPHGIGSLGLAKARSTRARDKFWIEPQGFRVVGDGSIDIVLCDALPRAEKKSCNLNGNFFD